MIGYRLLVSQVLCWMAVAQDASVVVHSSLRGSSEEKESCPRCDVIFSKVETTPSGERVQQIDMQERGEPKSGTALMFHGANGALAHACDFLNKWFGDGSCRLEGQDYNGRHHTPPHIGLTFDPQLGQTNALCPCDGVDMVEIRVSSESKHRLPVTNVCRWYHSQSIAMNQEGCWSVGGRPVEKYNDIRLCMAEANCEISDERLQFAILRDPRAEAVSMFIYEQRHKAAMTVQDRVGMDLDTLDEFVLATLPVLCHWVSLRHILFAGILKERSTVFWYEDALADPFKWHQEWLTFVGLHLPAAVVEGMSDVDLNGEFDFDRPSNGGNLNDRVQAGTKDFGTWRDRLRPETVVEMDRIVQQWLPAVILDKIGLVQH